MQKSDLLILQNSCDKTTCQKRVYSMPRSEKKLKNRVSKDNESRTDVILEFPCICLIKSNS